MDLPDPRLERYYYLLLKFMELSGYQVVVRANPSLLFNLRNYSELIYDIEGLQVTASRPARAVLCLSFDCTKGVVVDTDCFHGADTMTSFRWPFGMHPDAYAPEVYENLRARRGRERSIGILLAGNLSDSYRDDRNVIRGLFGKHPRWEMAECLRALPPDDIVRIAHRSDVERVFESHDLRNKLVMIEGPWLTPSQWFDLLASSRFFLALPGVLMPFCHNVAEAMAVGAVPILEYGEMFSPPLVHGENCIAFTCKDELVTAIHQLLDADESAVCSLRRRVIDYYDQYLDPPAVVERLVAATPPVDRLYLIAGHLSVAAMQRRLSRTAPAQHLTTGMKRP